MNYVLVVPQPRGQITLPKKFRDKYGIKPGIPVKMIDEGKGIRLEVMGDPLTVKPKYSKGEIVKRLEKYETSNKVYWTKEDDKVLSVLRKKDNKYLNW